MPGREKQEVRDRFLVMVAGGGRGSRGEGA